MKAAPSPAQTADSGLRAKLNAGVAWLAFVLLCALNLLPQIAWPYQLELLAHFRVQAALAALILPLGFWQLRMRAGIWLSLLLLAWNGFEILPWYLPPARSGATAERRTLESPGLKILLSNVLFYNDESRPLQVLLEEEQPDLIVLEELHLAHLAMMKQKSGSYPYAYLPESGSGAIGIWSRFPISSLRELSVDPHGTPAIRFELDWRGQHLEVLAVHPAAPINPELFARRNQELEILPGMFTTPQGDRILIGDLNITPWSPYYRRFEKAIGLYNSRRGFGLAPTWPTDWPGLLRIPLDHVLLSPTLRVLDLHTGPDLGSDHLPLLLTIAR